MYVTTLLFCLEAMRLIFYLPKFIFFFKHQCYPLQNSSLGQLHTDGDVVPTFGSSAGSLHPVWPCYTVRYAVLDVSEMTSFEDIFKFKENKKSQELRLGE